MPGDSVGGVKPASYPEEQAACRTVLRNARDAPDARLLIDMLGIVLDPEHQNSLRRRVP